MKKLYKLLVLMMVMAIGFTGCANNSNKTNSNEKTLENERQQTIWRTKTKTLHSQNAYNKSQNTDI